MSHIVPVDTQVKDAAAVRAACKRLGLAEPVQGNVKLFSGEATGLAIQRPNWNYPIIADLATGQLRYDNFGGRWGSDGELRKFLQLYAVEKCRIEARKAGRSLTEQTLSDGSIKLTIQVAGGAA